MLIHFDVSAVDQVRSFVGHMPRKTGLHSLPLAAPSAGNKRDGG